MRTRWILLAGIGLAAVVMFVVAQKPVVGHDREDHSKLVGT